MKTIIKLENIVKTYVQGKLKVNALRGISLDIDKGEFTAISGPSGSGKTTLLNIIGGLDKPTEGKIFIDKQNIVELKESDLATLRLNKIGFVFQAYNLVPVLSAFENVELVLALQGVPKTQRKEKVEKILEEVGLADLIHRRPVDMSGGQQHRVAVARAMVSKPKLILADEPTANLDSKTGASLLDMMHELNRNYKVTFLFSTHDPMVMEHSGRIIESV